MSGKNDLCNLTLVSLPSYSDLLVSTKPILTYCDRAHVGMAIIQGIYQAFGLLYECTETGCGQTWIVCCKCEAQRTKMRCRKAVYAHNELHKRQNNKRKQREEEGAENRTNPISAESTNDSSENNTFWFGGYDDSDRNHNGIFCDQDGDTNQAIISAAVSERPPAVLLPENCVLSSKQQISYMDCPEHGSLGFSDSRNERFFRYCQKRKHGTGLVEAGVEYLTLTCAVNSSRPIQLSDLRKLENIPTRFQSLLMDSAKLSFRAGKKDRDLLASIMKKQHENGLADGWVSCIDRMNLQFNKMNIVMEAGRDFIKGTVAEDFDDKFFQRGSHSYSKTFPTTTEEIRAKYISGKNSILANLPHPPVKSDVANHAYVSLEDCIRDALAFSRCRVQGIEDFTVSETRNMQWMFDSEDIDVDNACPLLTELLLRGKSKNLTDGADDEPNDQLEMDDTAPTDFDGFSFVSQDSDGDGSGSKDDYSVETEESCPPVIDSDEEAGSDSDDSTSVFENENEGVEEIVDGNVYHMNDVPGDVYVHANEADTHPFLLALEKSVDENEDASQPNNNDGICIDHPSRSKRALEIWCNAVKNHPDATSDGKFVSYIKFWSDDCDTNSQSMSGRAQVWVKTMTIATTTSNGNLVENTYPVAIGLKGASHDGIESYHAAELLQLQSENMAPFYCGEINKMVNCHFETLVNMGDQPEKRDINGFARGNATWAARSFVSANHKLLYHKLRACPKCHKQMVANIEEHPSNLPPLPRCNQCLNWDALKPNTNLNLVPLPAAYPYRGLPIGKGLNTLQVPGNIDRIVIRNGKRYLGAFRVTYTSMAAAVLEAHGGFCDCRWNIGHVRAFLSVEGLDGPKVNKFMEYAIRARALKYARARNDASPELIAHTNRCPELYGPMPLPSIHLRPGVCLRTHIEGLMHLIVIGVGKRAIWGIRQSQALREQEYAYRLSNGKYLLTVVNLKLSWLKAMEYKGKKLHGWNATNYLAFIRIMPWFYQTYAEADNQKVIKEVVLPPEDGQPKWTRIQNQYWLRLRRLNQSGNAAELTAKVAEYMKQTPPPPIIPPPDINLDEIDALIGSLLEVVECIFEKCVTESTVRRMEYALRIFLSNFDLLDRKIKKPKVPPQVISSYNFQCLLNIPEQMKNYGPIRDHWEGKKQGEAFLSEIKPLHKQGIRKNWAPNLLKSVFRDRSLRYLTEPSKAKPTNSVQDCSCLRNFQGNFRKYSSILQVHQTLCQKIRTEKKTLSVVILKSCGDDGDGARMFAVVGADYGVVELSILDMDDMTRMGLSYYNFNIEERERTTPWSTIIAETPSPQLGYAVLLPVLEPEGSIENCVFTVVASNWKRLGPRFTLRDLVD